MDFKQTNKPKKLEYVQNYFLQLVAYAEAHNASIRHRTYVKDISLCVVAVMTVWILGGETYQQFDVWPDEYDEWRHEWYNRVYTYYEKFA